MFLFEMYELYYTDAYCKTIDKIILQNIENRYFSVKQP